MSWKNTDDPVSEYNRVPKNERRFLFELVDFHDITGMGERMGKRTGGEQEEKDIPEFMGISTKANITPRLVSTECLALRLNHA